MNVQPRASSRRSREVPADLAWALYVDRPSRRLTSDDIESLVADLQLQANGGRVVTSLAGELI